MAAQVDEDTPPSATLVAICRTQECPAQGIPYVGLYYANAEPPTYRGQCMQCGQLITDLKPHEPASP